MAVTLDVAVLPPDDEQDEIVVACVRHAARRRGVDVEEAARTEGEETPEDIEDAEVPYEGAAPSMKAEAKPRKPDKKRKRRKKKGRPRRG